MDTQELRKFTILRSLRVLFRDIDLETIETISQNFLDLIQERKEELKRIEEQKALENKKYDDILKAFKEQGLDINEFADRFVNKHEPNKGSKRKGISMKPKYEFLDPRDDSTKCYWTGQGKLPKLFEDRLKADGRTKEDKDLYLIK